MGALASIERTAFPRFKRFLSARELHVFYTPQPEEITWAQGVAGSDAHLLAVMVQLKAFNRLGYFPGMEKVPAMVVEHIRRDLRLPDEVQPVYSSARTAERHRRLIRARSEVVYDPPAARKLAAEAIEEAARRMNDPADLINIALERLVEGSFELPAFRTLNDMATKIRGEVNDEIFAMVVARLGAVGVARLDGLRLVGARGGGWQERVQPVEADRAAPVVDELPVAVGAPGLGGRVRRRAGVVGGRAAVEDRRLRRRGRLGGRGGVG